MPDIPPPGASEVAANRLAVRTRRGRRAEQPALPVPPRPLGVLPDIAVHVAGGDRALMCDILLDHAVALEVEAGSRKNNAVRIALLTRAGRLRLMAEQVRP